MANRSDKALSPGNAALRFAVDGWAALAPGLSTQEDWLGWLREPRPLARELTADLSWMAAGLRRRVSPLGRAALGVLASCRSDKASPIVFASRYGDLDAITHLLTQLHAEGTVSPMSFSLSVHNAAIGIDSIARQDRTPATSIAARTDLAESAFFEAMGTLADGAGEVLVVCCEDSTPQPYRKHAAGQDFRYAWACRLRAVTSGGFSLGVASGETAGAAVEPAAAASPLKDPSLRALAFLTGAAGSRLLSETGRYLWHRHA